MRNKEITQRILNALGLSARYSGYLYILQAIELIAKDESLLTQTTKVLYVDISQICSTTPLCVERSIRYSIEIVWKHADKYADMIKQIFGCNYLNKKPSNKVFLELLYNHVRKLETNNWFILNNRCPIFGCRCHILEEHIFTKK